MEIGKKKLETVRRNGRGEKNEKGKKGNGNGEEKEGNGEENN